MSDDEPYLYRPYRYDKESTPGTAPFIPQLWAPVVEKALRSPTTVWHSGAGGPIKVTRRMRLRRVWWRVTDKWPLMWKKNCPEEDW